jgi:hypothetical protein
MTCVLPALNITSAIASLAYGSVFQFRQDVPASPRHLAIDAVFTYGSGGTSVDAYVQTSFNGGATWCDIAQFHVTTASAEKLYNLSSLTPQTSEITPTNGTLTANTAVDGLIGALLRVAYKSSGTYGGSTTLQVDVDSNDRLVAWPAE